MIYAEYSLVLSFFAAAKLRKKVIHEAVLYKKRVFSIIPIPVFPHLQCGKQKVSKARMDLIFDTIHEVGQELVAV